MRRVLSERFYTTMAHWSGICFMTQSLERILRSGRRGMDTNMKSLTVCRLQTWVVFGMADALGRLVREVWNIYEGADLLQPVVWINLLTWKYGERKTVLSHLVCAVLNVLVAVWEMMRRVAGAGVSLWEIERERSWGDREGAEIAYSNFCCWYSPTEWKWNKTSRFGKWL